jgi:hypothetical protein
MKRKFSFLVLFFGALLNADSSSLAELYQNDRAVEYVIGNKECEKSTDFFSKLYKAKIQTNKEVIKNFEAMAPFFEQLLVMKTPSGQQPQFKVVRAVSKDSQKTFLFFEDEKTCKLTLKQMENQ